MNGAMRVASLAAVLLAACAGIATPPVVVPAPSGPNAVEFGGLQLASPAPAETATFYAALLGGTITTEGDVRTVRLAPDSPGLRIEAGAGSATPLAFTMLDFDAALTELAARRIPFELATVDTRPRARFVDADGRSVTLTAKDGDPATGGAP